MQRRLLRLKADAPKLFPVDLFKPMAALSRRSWFQRLWIVQEYLLARKVIFLCGDNFVDGDKLRNTLRKLSLYSFDGNISLDEGEPVFEGFRALGDLNRIKEGLANDDHQSLFDFVMLGRSRLAKEPVDRIYAMLGLARETDNMYTAELPIDYSTKTTTEYWRVFAQFGKIALRSEAHLRLLSVSSSFKRPEELPSWCPNFCSSAELGPLDEVLVFAAGWPWKDHVNPIAPEHCTGHPHFKSPQDSHVVTRDDSNVISIWGAKLDCVENILGEKTWNTLEEPNSLDVARRLARELLTWLLKCDEFCITHGKYDSSPMLGRTSWNSLLVHESSKRTRPGEQNSSLVSDLSPDTAEEENPSSSGIDGETDVAYIYLIETLTALLDLEPEDQSERGKKVISDFDTLWTWILFLDQSWDERALFATKDGYLGCGPNGVAVGDVVCMLYGGRTLYILREIGDTYCLVGEAYVYQCMGGELFEMLDEGSIQEKEFSIC